MQALVLQASLYHAATAPESYSKGGKKLTAGKIALRLDIEAIQAALSPITDERYSALVCSYLPQAKDLVLSP